MKMLFWCRCGRKSNLTNVTDTNLIFFEKIKTSKLIRNFTHFGEIYFFCLAGGIFLKKFLAILVRKYGDRLNFFDC